MRRTEEIRNVTIFMYLFGINRGEIRKERGVVQRVQKWNVSLNTEREYTYEDNSIDMNNVQEEVFYWLMFNSCRMKWKGPYNMILALFTSLWNLSKHLKLIYTVLRFLFDYYIVVFV